MPTLVALLVVLVGLIPWSARADLVACGATITADTVLDADLVGCAGDGLVIEGESEVTLDLNGHEITGQGLGVGIAIYGSNVTVTNGTISNFGSGVDDYEQYAVVVLRNLTVGHNGWGISAWHDFGGSFALEDSFVHHNAGNGVSLVGQGTRFRISRNVIERNGQSGIEASFAEPAMYEDNVVRRNGLDGISIYDATSTLVGNTVRGNGGYGILVVDDYNLFFP